MPNPLISNPGSGGYTFSADVDGSSIYWTYSKMAFGANGTQTPVSTTNPLPIQEIVSVTETDASTTIGTTAATAINAGLVTKWLDIENVSTNGNLLGYTLDGSTPVISGGVPGAGTMILLPFGTKTYDKRIPAGALKIIGSAAGTVVTIKYA